MTIGMRIATFNLENLDGDLSNPETLKKAPSLATRIQILKPQLMRLRADVLCLQEVNGQDVQGGGRKLDRAGAASERHSIRELLLSSDPYC